MPALFIHPKKTVPHWRRLAWALLLGGACLGAFSSGAAVDPRGPGPATHAIPTPEAEKAAAELGIGRWIWTTNFTDKQVCRLWRTFAIPSGAMLLAAAKQEGRILNPHGMLPPNSRRQAGLRLVGKMILPIRVDCQSSFRR